MVVVKKRLLPLFLAFVVAVGCVANRPQKTYAAELVAAEGLEVLFGLLGAAGVVVGFEESMEQRMEEAQKMFDSLPAAQQQSYIDWLAAGEFVTSDTGHTVFYPDMALDTSWYSNLWQSVTGVVDSYNVAVLPLSDFITVEGLGVNVPKTTFAVGSVSDSSYFVCYRGSSYDVVYCVPEDGLAVRCTVSSSNGAVSNLAVYSVDSIQLDIEGSKSTVYPDAVSGWINYKKDGVLGTFGLGGFSIPYDGYEYTGIRFKNADGVFGKGVCPGVDNVLSVCDGAIVGVDELIPCDTWVSKWDDAKAENRQVGIITGQDLSGYNTLDDIYNPETGLVTGLDSPVVTPEIPVTPDLTGIAGGLASILSWLKALPATLANTFLGNADLNFDALKNSGFTTKFPFCIPFDLYNCIAQLVASPVPPVFTLSFAGTVMESAGDIVIDMSKFETLAKILRYFIFFGFVLGLIKLTRNLIKG